VKTPIMSDDMTISTRANARVAELFEDRFRNAFGSTVPGKSAVTIALGIVRRARAGRFDGLRACGFKVGPSTNGLFRAALYCEKNGWTGVSPMSLIEHVLRHTAYGVPQIVGKLIGDDAPLNIWCEEVVSGADLRIMVYRAGDAAVFDGHDVLVDALGDVPEGCTRLFHGTSMDVAHKILKNGIDNDELGHRSDFGQAFYTTPDVACAVYYVRLTGEPRAIVVFDVKSDEFARLTDSRRIDWDVTVRSFRRQRRDERALLLDEALVLQGPIVANGNELDKPGPILAQAACWVQVAFRVPHGAKAIDALKPGNIVQRVSVLRG
jgi:hypothetical protein